MESPQRPNRRDIAARETRADILKAARKVFARDGYADAALSAIVKAAHVTTGAIYHHFGDKKGVFRAVAENLEAELMQQVVAAAIHESDPWQQMLAGTREMLKLCLTRDVRTILFQDAPTVIGIKAWREIEHRYALGMMIAMLTGLKTRNVISVASPELAAVILLGAFSEAANAVALSADPENELLHAQAMIENFLNSLKV
jgi:AcrR family transcriptional regulator